MKNKIYFANILIFFVLLCFKISFADYDVEINKRAISMNEPVVIKITLNSNDGDLRVEESKDFSITNRNVFVNTEIVNFKATVKKTYEFTLFPNKEGELKTPRFVISADGEESYVEPETINVSKNNYSTNSSRNSSSSSVKKHNRSKGNAFSILDDEEEELNSIFDRVEKLKKQIFGDEEGEDSSNNRSRRNRSSLFNFFRKSPEIFVKSSIPNENVYVNQQVLYTIDLYVPVDQSVQFRLMPSVNQDILIQEIEPDKDFEAEYEGNLYNVHRMFVTLYPMKPGEVDIKPFDVNCNSSKYGWRTYKADGFHLSILDLPEPKPDDFSQGVGDFDFNISCDTTLAEVSKPFTLTLQVKGEGNASSVNLVPPVLEGFDKFNDSETIARNEENDRIIETKELKSVFVPSEGGEIEIPSITLSFFDPVSGQYYSKTSESIKLKVLGDKKKNKSEGFTGNNEIRVFVKDKMTFRNSDGILTNPYIISFSFLPFLGFMILFIKNKISKIHFESNNSKSTGKAFSELKKDLKKCSEKDYAKVSESLVKYLANKLELEDKGLTTKAILAELRKKCDDEDLIGKIKDIFILCDEARFNSDVVVDSGT
ncbi:BatD family protein, partial [bacterium]|nr:BatD family protein [bacterium]